MEVVAGETIGQSLPTKSDDEFNLENKFKPLYDSIASLQEMVQSQSSKPRIQKASSILLHDDKMKEYIEPKAYSFGPIHHGKPKFQQGEKIKLELAATFLRDHAIHKDKAYLEIQENIESFRQCYDEEVVKKYNDDELCWILFVDGCALLRYIELYMERGMERGLQRFDIMHRGRLSFALTDIFLLENQIPFDVLDMLMQHMQYEPNKPHKMWLYVINFVEIQCMRPGLVTGTELTEHKPNHLLEFLWMIIRQPQGLSRLPSSEIRSNPLASSFNICVGKLNEVVHYLALKIPHRFYVMSPSSQPQVDLPLWSPTYSVNELKRVRINFKAAHKSACLKNITFSKSFLSGKLEIPSITVDDSSGVKLANLIAFEMCYDFKNDLEVSSYICFVNSILATAEDVAYLRSTGILVNFLPSDMVVYYMFRRLAYKVLPNPEISEPVKRNIQKYCESKRRTTVATWLTEAMQVYFKTPWSTIAVLAAIFAMVLSFIQTYFTVFPR